MPKEKKKKLNPEEKEVHDALFGPESDDSTLSASPITSHQTSSSKPPPPLEPDIIINDLNNSTKVNKPKKAHQAKKQAPVTKFNLDHMEQLYNQMHSFMSNVQNKSKKKILY